MSTETSTAKQAIHDKLDSQVKSAQSKLESLKAKAETASAAAKTIADLLIKKQIIDKMLTDLKKSGESHFQQQKTDLEARIADLEKSVQAIEAKFKAA